MVSKLISKLATKVLTTNKLVSKRLIKTNLEYKVVSS